MGPAAEGMTAEAARVGRTDLSLVSQQIHLAADRRCRPLAFVLTAGQAADSPQFMPVLKRVRVRLPLGRPRTRPGAVAADKAYSSRGNRAYLRKRNIKAVIPEKKDQAANRKNKGGPHPRKNKGGPHPRAAPGGRCQGTIRTAR
ncbi:transposase IS4 family protein [Streptomyces sparsogenes DSM 40356]|uniref:Transposase IS4 family protein n=1 Tax=Streptomyces sparsogenes DSM 40356 TaxID=1331668 RepID=A0A1R1SMN7_9ACTN|nr:transposase IS4 family protein [Streptomyces sparsogenes DSM 40356]